MSYTNADGKFQKTSSWKIKSGDKTSESVTTVAAAQEYILANASENVILYAQASAGTDNNMVITNTVGNIDDLHVSCSGVFEKLSTENWTLEDYQENGLTYSVKSVNVPKCTEIEFTNKSEIGNALVAALYYKSYTNGVASTANKLLSATGTSDKLTFEEAPDSIRIFSNAQEFTITLGTVPATAGTMYSVDGSIPTKYSLANTTVKFPTVAFKNACFTGWSVVDASDADATPVVLTKNGTDYEWTPTGAWENVTAIPTYTTDNCTPAMVTIALQDSSLFGVNWKVTYGTDETNLVDGKVVKVPELLGVTYNVSVTFTDPRETLKVIRYNGVWVDEEFTLNRKTDNTLLAAPEKSYHTIVFKDNGTEKFIAVTGNNNTIAETYSVNASGLLVTIDPADLPVATQKENGIQKIWYASEKGLWKGYNADETYDEQLTAFDLGSITFKAPGNDWTNTYWDENSFDLNTDDALPDVVFLKNGEYYSTNTWYLTKVSGVNESSSATTSKNALIQFIERNFRDANGEFLASFKIAKDASDDQDAFEPTYSTLKIIPQNISAAVGLTSTVNSKTFSTEIKVAENGTEIAMPMTASLALTVGEDVSLKLYAVASSGTKTALTITEGAVTIPSGTASLEIYEVTSYTVTQADVADIFQVGTMPTTYTFDESITLPNVASTTKCLDTWTFTKEGVTGSVGSVTKNATTGEYTWAPGSTYGAVTATPVFKACTDPSVITATFSYESDALFAAEIPVTWSVKYGDQELVTTNATTDEQTLVLPKLSGLALTVSATANDDHEVINSISWNGVQIPEDGSVTLTNLTKAELGVSASANYYTVTWIDENDDVLFKATTAPIGSDALVIENVYKKTATGYEESNESELPAKNTAENNVVYKWVTADATPVTWNGYSETKTFTANTTFKKTLNTSVADYTIVLGAGVPAMNVAGTYDSDPYSATVNAGGNKVAKLDELTFTVPAGTALGSVNAVVYNDGKYELKEFTVGTAFTVTGDSLLIYKNGTAANTITMDMGSELYFQASEFTESYKSGDVVTLPVVFDKDGKQVDTWTVSSAGSEIAVRLNKNLDGSIDWFTSGVDANVTIAPVYATAASEMATIALETSPAGIPVTWSVTTAAGTALEVSESSVSIPNFAGIMLKVSATSTDASNAIQSATFNDVAATVANNEATADVAFDKNGTLKFVVNYANTIVWVDGSETLFKATLNADGTIAKAFKNGDDGFEAITASSDLPKSYEFEGSAIVHWEATDKSVWAGYSATAKFASSIEYVKTSVTPTIAVKVDGKDTTEAGIYMSDELKVFGASDIVFPRVIYGNETDGYKVTAKWQVSTGTETPSQAEYYISRIQDYMLAHPAASYTVSASTADANDSTLVLNVVDLTGTASTTIYGKAFSKTLTAGANKVPAISEMKITADDVQMIMAEFMDASGTKSGNSFIESGEVLLINLVDGVKSVELSEAEFKIAYAAVSDTFRVTDPSNDPSNYIYGTDVVFPELASVKQCFTGWAITQGEGSELVDIATVTKTDGKFTWTPGTTYGNVTATPTFSTTPCNVAVTFTDDATYGVKWTAKADTVAITVTADENDAHKFTAELPKLAGLDYKFTATPTDASESIKSVQKDGVALTAADIYTVAYSDASVEAIALSASLSTEYYYVTFRNADGVVVKAHAKGTDLSDSVNANGVKTSLPVRGLEAITGGVTYYTTEVGGVKTLWTDGFNFTADQEFVQDTSKIGFAALPEESYWNGASFAVLTATEMPSVVYKDGTTYKKSSGWLVVTTEIADVTDVTDYIKANLGADVTLALDESKATAAATTITNKNLVGATVAGTVLGNTFSKELAIGSNVIPQLTDAKITGAEGNTSALSVKIGTANAVAKNYGDALDIAAATAVTVNETANYAIAYADTNDIKYTSGTYLKTYAYGVASVAFPQLASTEKCFTGWKIATEDGSSSEIAAGEAWVPGEAYGKATATAQFSAKKCNVTVVLTDNSEFGAKWSVKNNEAKEELVKTSGEVQTLELPRLAGLTFNVSVELDDRESTPVITWNGSELVDGAFTLSLNETASELVLNTSINYATIVWADQLGNTIYKATTAGLVDGKAALEKAYKKVDAEFTSIELADLPKSYDFEGATIVSWKSGTNLWNGYEEVAEFGNVTFVKNVITPTFAVTVNAKDTSDADVFMSEELKVFGTAETLPSVVFNSNGYKTATKWTIATGTETASKATSSVADLKTYMLANPAATYTIAADIASATASNKVLSVDGVENVSVAGTVNGKAFEIALENNDNNIPAVTSVTVSAPEGVTVMAVANDADATTTFIVNGDALAIPATATKVGLSLAEFDIAYADTNGIKYASGTYLETYAYGVASVALPQLASTEKCFTGWKIETVGGQSATLAAGEAWVPGEAYGNATATAQFSETACNVTVTFSDDATYGVTWTAKADSVAISITPVTGETYQYKAEFPKLAGLDYVFTATADDASESITSVKNGKTAIKAVDGIYTVAYSDATVDTIALSASLSTDYYYVTWMNGTDIVAKAHAKGTTITDITDADGEPLKNTPARGLTVTNDGVAYYATDINGKATLWAEGFTFTADQTFKLDTTKVGFATLPAENYWNGDDFAVLSATEMPTVVFKDGTTYKKSSAWLIGETEIANVAGITDYIKAKLGVESVSIALDESKATAFATTVTNKNLVGATISGTVLGNAFSKELEIGDNVIPMLEKTVVATSETNENILNIEYNKTSINAAYGAEFTATANETAFTISEVAGYQIAIAGIEGTIYKNADYKTAYTYGTASVIFPTLASTEKCFTGWKIETEGGQSVTLAAGEAWVPGEAYGNATATAQFSATTCNVVVTLTDNSEFGAKWSVKNNEVDEELVKISEEAQTLELPKLAGLTFNVSVELDDHESTPVITWNGAELVDGAFTLSLNETASELVLNTSINYATIVWADQLGNTIYKATTAGLVDGKAALEKAYKKVDDEFTSIDLADLPKSYDLEGATIVSWKSGTTLWNGYEEVAEFGNVTFTKNVVTPTFAVTVNAKDTSDADVFMSEELKVFGTAETLPSVVFNSNGYKTATKWTIVTGEETASKATSAIEDFKTYMLANPAATYTIAADIASATASNKVVTIKNFEGLTISGKVYNKEFSAELAKASNNIPLLSEMKFSAAEDADLFYSTLSSEDGEVVESELYALTLGEVVDFTDVESINVYNKVAYNITVVEGENTYRVNEKPTTYTFNESVGLPRIASLEKCFTGYAITDALGNKLADVANVDDEYNWNPALTYGDVIATAQFSAEKCNITVALEDEAAFDVAWSVKLGTQEFVEEGKSSIELPMLNGLEYTVQATLTDYEKVSGITWNGNSVEDNKFTVEELAENGVLNVQVNANYHTIRWFSEEDGDVLYTAITKPIPAEDESAFLELAYAYKADGSQIELSALPVPYTWVNETLYYWEYVAIGDGTVHSWKQGLKFSGDVDYIYTAYDKYVPVLVENGINATISGTVSPELAYSETIAAGNNKVPEADAWTITSETEGLNVLVHYTDGTYETIELADGTFNVPGYTDSLIVYEANETTHKITMNMGKDAFVQDGEFATEFTTGSVVTFPNVARIDGAKVIAWNFSTADGAINGRINNEDGLPREWFTAGVTSDVTLAPVYGTAKYDIAKITLGTDPANVEVNWTVTTLDGAELEIVDNEINVPALEGAKLSYTVTGNDETYTLTKASFNGYDTEASDNQVAAEFSIDANAETNNLVASFFYNSIMWVVDGSAEFKATIDDEGKIIAAYKATADGFEAIDASALPAKHYFEKDTIVSWSRTIEDEEILWEDYNAESSYEAVTYNKQKLVPTFSYVVNDIAQADWAANEVLWNGASFDPTVASAALPTAMFFEDAYKTTNYWFIGTGEIAVSSAVTTTDVLREYMLEYPAAEYVITASVADAEIFNNKFVVKNAENVTVSGNVLGNTFTKTLEIGENDIPTMTAMTVNATEGTNLMVEFINAEGEVSEAAEVALGDAFTIPENAATTQFFEATTYTIARGELSATEAEKVGTIFQVVNEPVEYAYRASEVKFPELASVNACFAGWKISNAEGEIATLESAVENAYTWEPGETFGDVTATPVFNTEKCNVTATFEDNSRYSVAWTIASGKNNFEVVENKAILPKLAGLKFTATATLEDASEVLAAVTLNGEPLTAENGIYTIDNNAEDFALNAEIEASYYYVTFMDGDKVVATAHAMGSEFTDIKNAAGKPTTLPAGNFENEGANAYSYYTTSLRDETVLWIGAEHSIDTTVTFVKKSVNVTFAELGEAEFWNGNGFVLTTATDLPAVAFKNEEGAYVKLNSWKYGETDFTTAGALLERMAENVATLADIKLTLDKGVAAEPFNLAITNKNLEGAMVAGSVFGNVETFELALGETNIPAVASVTFTNETSKNAINVTIADAVSEAAYGSAVALNGADAITVSEDATYEIAVAAIDGKIYKLEAYPTTYRFGDASVAFPKIASLDKCFTGWTIATADGSEQTIASGEAWVPGEAFGNATATANFNAEKCNVRATLTDNSKYSVAWTVTVDEETFEISEVEPNAYEVELPRLEGIVYSITAVPSDASESIAKISADGVELKVADNTVTYKLEDESKTALEVSAELDASYYYVTFMDGDKVVATAHAMGGEFTDIKNAAGKPTTLPAYEFTEVDGAIKYYTTTVENKTTLWTSDFTIDADQTFNARSATVSFAKLPEVNYWNGDNFTALSAEEFPTVVYLDGTAYKIANAWTINGNAATTSVEAITSYIMENLDVATRGVTLALATATATDYTLAVTNKNLVGATITGTVLGKPFSMELVEGVNNIPMLANATVTSTEPNTNVLSVTINGKSTATAYDKAFAVGTNTLTISEVATYEVAINTPDIAGTVYTNAEYPSNYVYGDAKLTLPALANVNACFTGWDIEYTEAGKEKTAQAIANGNAYEWTIGETYGNVYATPKFSDATCNVEVRLADESLYGVDWVLATESETFEFKEVEPHYYVAELPKLEGIKFMVRSTAVDPSESVKMVALNGKNLVKKGDSYEFTYTSEFENSLDVEAIVNVDYYYVTWFDPTTEKAIEAITDANGKVTKVKVGEEYVANLSTIPAGNLAYDKKTNSFSYWTAYVNDDMLLWNGDASILYDQSVSFEKNTFELDRLEFVRPEINYWNGNDFNIFESKVLPEIVTLSAIGEYVVTNSWIVRIGGDEKAFTNSEDVIEFMKENVKYLYDGIEFVPNEDAAENFNIVLEADNVKSVTVTGELFGQKLEFAATENNEFVSIPKMNELSIATSSKDSLRVFQYNDNYMPIDTSVIVNNERTVTAQGATRITIAPKSYYDIEVVLPKEYGRIFVDGEMPKTFYYRQDSISFPQIGTTTSCFVGYDINEVVSEGNVWNPERTNRSIVATAIFDTTCVPERKAINIAADSNVIVYVTYEGDTLETDKDNKVYLPAFGEWPVVFYAQSLNNAVSVDSIEFNGTKVAIGETLSINKNSTLDVFTTTANPHEDKFFFDNMKVVLSGSAMRLKIKTKDFDVENNVALHVMVYANDTVFVDTLLTDKASASEYVYDYFPLPAGTYHAEATLAGITDTAYIATEDWEITAKTNAVAAKQWTMISLNDVSDSFKIPENSEGSILYWDEESPIGEYMQYRVLSSLDSIDPTRGYWFASRNETEIERNVDPEAVIADSIVWNLKNKFSGWNMIANPYSWNVDLGTEGFVNPEDSTEVFWRWNAELSEYEPADTINAYEGLWIYTEEDRDYTIASKPVFVSDDTVKAAQKSSANSMSSWALRLKLLSENGKADSWNVVGVGSREINVAEPPSSMDEGINLSLEHGNEILAKSIKTSVSDATWNVAFKASTIQRAKLSVEGLEDLETLGLEATLDIDGRTVKLSADEDVDVTLSALAKNAVLTVSPVNAIVKASGIMNMRYAVDGRKLNVSFELAESAAGKNVDVRLVDIHGKTVTFNRETAQAGLNKASVETPANSGIYFLRVTVGGDSKLVKFKF